MAVQHFALHLEGDMKGMTTTEVGAQGKKERTSREGEDANVTITVI